MSGNRASRIKSSVIFTVSFTLILLVFVWVALRVAPIRSLENSQALANWIIAISAIISAVTAILAAAYLYLTLQATEQSTNLLTLQLQQNRAYMVVESTTLTPCYDKDELGFTHIDVRVNWLNTGSSPAVNLTTYVEFGPLTPGMEDYLDIDHEHLDHAQITLGQNMKKVIDQPILKNDIDHILAHSPSQAGYLFSVCLYEDIYGNKYQSEYCISIPIPMALLSSIRNIIAAPELTLVRFGKRNQEKTINYVAYNQ